MKSSSKLYFCYKLGALLEMEESEKQVGIYNFNKVLKEVTVTET